MGCVISLSASFSARKGLQCDAAMLICCASLTPSGRAPPLRAALRPSCCDGLSAWSLSHALLSPFPGVEACGQAS